MTAKKHEKFTEPKGGSANILPEEITIKGFANIPFTMVLRRRGEAFYCPTERLSEGRAVISRIHDYYENGLIKWRNIFGPSLKGVRIAQVDERFWQGAYFSHNYIVETDGCYHSSQVVHELGRIIRLRLEFYGAPAKAE